MNFTLLNHQLGYSFRSEDALFSLKTVLSGAPYAKRHWEQSTNEKNQVVWQHRLIAMIEFIPVVGALAAVIERIVVWVYKTFFYILPYEIPRKDGVDSTKLLPEKALTQILNQQTATDLISWQRVNKHWSGAISTVLQDQAALKRIISYIKPLLQPKKYEWEQLEGQVNPHKRLIVLGKWLEGNQLEFVCDVGLIKHFFYDFYITFDFTITQVEGGPLDYYMPSIHHVEKCVEFRETWRANYTEQRKQIHDYVAASLPKLVAFYKKQALRLTERK